MENLATTKMTSKGQIIIPENIRKRLKLKSGSQFMVLGADDVVILKAITPPSIHDFDVLIAAVRKQASASGMKQSDISAAITKARGGK